MVRDAGEGELDGVVQKRLRVTSSSTSHQQQLGEALGCWGRMAAGIGSMLACAASSYGAVMHVQACWNRAEGEAERWGIRLFLLLSSGSHGRGLGMGAGKSTAWERGSVCGYCYGARAYEGAVCYSGSNFPESCPQCVRHNVRKKQFLEFWNFSTWVQSSNG
jgi:hypothetical protein